jgi:hypothetical protein
VVFSYRLLCVCPWGLAETKVYICLALDNEHQLIVNDLSHHFEIIIIQTKIIFCCWNGVEIKYGLIQI